MNCFDFLNSRHCTIWFTFEKQNEAKLSFLDVLVSTTEENLGTSVFCNTKSIALYANFTSYTPFPYKTGLTKTLLHRACEITSFWTLFDKESHKTKSLLMKITHLSQLINREIKTFPHGKFFDKEVIFNANKEVSYYELPYIDSYSNSTSKKN